MNTDNLQYIECVKCKSLKKVNVATSQHEIHKTLRNSNNTKCQHDFERILSKKEADILELLYEK